LSSGQFVEFRAVLRKNPLVEYIETFKQVLDIADLFPDEAVETSHSAGSAGRAKKPKSAKPDQKKNQDLPLYKQMQGLQEALVQSGSLELLGEMLDAQEARSVLSTNLEFFSDSNASELIDGEFRVLGKVVRVVNHNSGGSINLLRKTAFGRFDSSLFDQLGQVVAGAEESGINLPEFRTRVEGPAIQVIPISIFV